MGKRSKPPVDPAFVAHALGGELIDRHFLHMLNEVGNVGHVCEEHSSKPGGFMGSEPASFVGRAVKLCFPRAVKGTENMWVRVERIGKADEGGELVGTLGNEPMSPLAAELGDLHIGDWLAFDVAEIAAVDPPIEVFPRPSP